MATNAVIDRSSLGLGDLVIYDSCQTGSPSYVFTEDGFGDPSVVPAVNVETNMFLDGGLPTMMRLEPGQIPWKVIVLGDTATVLQTRIDALVRAVAMQFVYTIVTTLDDDDPRTWDAWASPISIDGNARTPTWRAAHAAVMVATISVQPRPY